MKITLHLLSTVALLLALTLPHLASAADSAKYLIYIGTYTSDDGKPTTSKGIYAYRYDSASGQIISLGLAAETTNPSWVVISPNGKFLYAVNEVGDYQGPNSGGVSAFSIDRATGKLTFLNEVASRGADPCYISVDKTGKWALVANYTGGSIAVFPIGADGKLGEPSSVVQHKGHGANPKRQEGPHAHSIDLSPDNRFAYVDDLGLDEVVVYRFDSAKGTLTPNDPPLARLDPGTGPRHFALRPDGKFAYVVGEMGHTVTLFSNDAASGKLQSLQSVATLPKDFQGRNDDAELRMHPTGKFLYASNRGEDTVVAYAIDEKKGMLSQLQSIATGGKEPRSFEIDFTGTLLFAANQKSDNIVVFGIDKATGKLKPTGKVLNVGAPVSLKFLKID